MENLPALGFMFGLWVAGLVLFHFGGQAAKLHAKEERRHRQPTAPLKPEQFSGWYPFLYYSGAVLFLLTALLLGFFMPFGLVKVQHLLYASNAIAFLDPDALVVGLMISSFFLSMAITGSLLIWSYGASPKFSIYQRARDRYNFARKGVPKEERKKVWEQMLRTTPPRSRATDWSEICMLILIMWSWTIPFTILALDSYSKLTNDGFVINPFWSLQEKKYPWRDVAIVRVYGEIVQSYSKYQTEPKYQLNPKMAILTTDGKTRYLWESFGGVGVPTAEELARFLQGLHAGGVHLTYEPLDARQQAMLDGYGQRSNHLWTTVVDYIRSVEPTGNNPGFRSR